MKCTRCLAIATALCAAVMCMGASAASVAPQRLAVYRAQIQVISASLDARALQLRHAPGKAAFSIPKLHIPPAPLDRAPTYSPSLDDWLQSNLVSIRKLNTNRARATRLAALAVTLRQLARAPTTSVAPALDAQREALNILSAAAYRPKGAGPAPEPRESLWLRILRWFGNLIGEIFSRVFEGAASVPLIGRVLAGALLLALLALIGYAMYTLLRLFRRRLRADAAELGQPLAPAWNPESLYERGLAAANAGRYAEAISLLFQASLVYFDSAGKVDYDAARTAGEYRRLVRRRIAAASPHFDALSGAFTYVAYAERTPSAQDWSYAQNAFLALRPLLVS